jgi:defect-in-organelle-trafficking protein DotD
MYRLIILSSFSLLLLVATGCTILKKPPENNTIYSQESKRLPKGQTASSTANIEAQLLAAAQSIEGSLNTLAAAEKVESPPILNTAPLVTPEGGMGGTIDIEWTGPIGPLVNKIAALTNYRVKVLGQEPAIPILVSISMKRAIIADVLQNASFQVGKRAHILVFPGSRLIEVRYLS